MDNQERNREALIDHIDELQRIILRRNQQIENQAHNAEEDQRVIDEQDARNNSLAADLGAAVVRAEKAEQERDEWEKIARTAERDADEAEENTRPLTADDEEVLALALVEADRLGHRIGVGTMRHILRATLTPPPARPEGAEELEALIDRASLDGEDADNESLADYLATRLLDPTVKES